MLQGAVLEFVHGYNEQDARKALTMPGGGVWHVGPGQPTDDSELMLALLHGLRGQDPFKEFPAQVVASRYKEWYQSPPFDVGNTCANAFSVSDPSKMAAAAAKFNMAMESNGALMRGGPIAVWCALHGVTDDAIVAAHARADSRLSHCSQESIFKVLMLRGDTDTNACIVGYIMGALRGVAGIPEFMKGPVLAFDCTQPERGIARLGVYRAAWADTLIAEMWRGESSAQQCQGSN
ncbi:ADP-ribosylation/Crystallin J1 [Dunaliella salina]|uniref:ADP-ribosylation/Crystallin J1 n=1 Tax=Dunaliella salina TaxID=3046 RepID=A0ABQ7G635_DUNSA|nr:ADP-ribosylation/Crystallin J1 [Dunaliella salina]|eukprot:KAF5830063.1 ADP-ribosylation/Crystallin J1 [Dunaliella salina]